ncbi:hypothetical protein H5410_040766 [Solanum commersonii]|uniref:(S)-2-hydroxy-acid oxidase n=1 Tax=Solanum commersonii TaxID=4109 RepID=A0A9J5XSG9_SOLCO|nr:hypothetical protein H5410_040766 [Solanum commersonii]
MSHKMESVTNVMEYEILAKERLPKMIYDYYASGAEDQWTLQENRNAFSRILFRPRILVDVSNIDTTTSVLGFKISMPIMVAPTAMQKMAHPEGENATARATSAAGTIMTLSSWGTSSVEEVASTGPGIRFFQLYVYKDRNVVMQLVKRAERVGFKAIALTVDTPRLGRREADIKNRFVLPPNLSLKNFDGLDLGKIDKTDDSRLASYVAGQVDRSLSWKDVKWLQTITHLPILLKGVLTAEDARLAVESGAAGIIVSNHGARQLDYAPATIMALEEGDGQSSIANNFEVHLDTLIDTNFLLVGTDSFMGDEHSGHADQVFDESSHQIEESVHEFDIAFDLVEDNSMGLQMPLQLIDANPNPEIDYRGDMHSRKSNVAEDECLETNTDIVFGGSLQRNESTLHGQFANLKLVVTENSVFHETLSSNFHAPIRVDGEISLIPRDDEDEIAESYPSLFNQSFFAHFEARAIESMTDGLPTCYWFDTGQYVSQSITFVFRRRKCGDHLSAMDFDKNDYFPIIGAQGGNVQYFAIMCSSCYSSGDDSKTACEGAAHNWLLDVLASYVLAKESGNSKVHQMFDTISNEAWKVSNVMFTLLLVGVLVETPKETRNVQQLHLTDKEYLFITFGGREPIV